MNNLNTSLIEIHETQSPGFVPAVDSDQWRVAFLNFEQDSLPTNLKELQRHNESDEVFVLLKGHCILFLGGEECAVSQIYAQELEPCKIYKVRRRVWHAQALSPDTKLLIVENRNTSLANSPRLDLTEYQRTEILSMTRQIWGEEY
jgi:ureidoglycolate hydrolase